jgi:uncharacterized membrane protein YeaQ/YmgE (transglycosylase-associated protein family)
MGILSWIIVGAIAGWLAGYLTKTSAGLLENIVLGVVGGLFGGFILDLAGIGVGMNGIGIESIFTATLGAVLLIVIRRALSGSRR